MKKIIIVLFLSLVFVGFSQEVLFSINKQDVTVDEFRRIYEKNLLIVSDSEKDIDKNVQRFIDFKLKVVKALDLKLDTTSNYQRDVSSYKTQLISQKLHDQDFQEKLIKEAYERIKTEVRASHILLLFPKDKKADTLAMYRKLMNARRKIINGQPFEYIAQKISEDPSVKTNKGDVGYFSAFRMVYPFENVAYTTKKGEVSKPFRTRFGYHILTVKDKRPSNGEFEVAHIVVKDSTSKGKQKVQSAYQEIKSGALFANVVKKFSQEKASASNGGKLPKFRLGSMEEKFEKQILNLNEGEYSKPFKTKYGWHIAKLIKKHPVPNFEKIKPILANKVRGGGRGGLSFQIMIDKLKRKYKIKENKKAFSIFENIPWSSLKKESLNKTILKINKEKISQKQFYNFLATRKKSSIKKRFEDFKNYRIVNYFKENLEKTNPDFKYELQEYKDGLLSFDVLQKLVWSPSKNNKEIEGYYNVNKEKYNKPLKEVRADVVADYQKIKEESLLSELRENNKIKINNKVLNRLKKIYK